MMYETQALWGLEDNPNANTINCTFNTVTELPIILITVVVVIAVAMALTTRRAF